MSLPRCENFYNTIYNENERYDVNKPDVVDQKTIGIRLNKYWNKNRQWEYKGKKYNFPGWELITNKDGYFTVGKVTKRYGLSEQINTGDVVLSINDIDLRKISKDSKKLKILQKDVSDLFEVNELIKFKLLRNGKVFVVDKLHPISKKPNIINSLESFNAPRIDFYINSIDVNEKEGSFDASIETMFKTTINQRFFLTGVVWDQLVYDKKYENGKIKKYFSEDCHFSDERWGKLNTVDPAYGLRFANLIKEDRQVRDSKYIVKPFGLWNQPEAEAKAQVIYKSTSLYKIKNNFNLKTFPFDRQNLKIFLYNDHSGYSGFRSVVTSSSIKKAIEFKEANSIQGWNIVKADMNYEYYNDATKSYKDGVIVEFEIV